MYQFFNRRVRVRIGLFLLAFSLTTPAFAQVPDPIESLEPDPQPSILQRVDGVFESAVEAIASVLFRRIFAQDRVYIQFDHNEDYVRDEGSDGDFQRYDPNGEYPESTLNDQQIAGLAARGMLVLGPNQNEIRQG